MNFHELILIFSTFFTQSKDMHKVLKYGNRKCRYLFTKVQEVVQTQNKMSEQ